MIGLKILIKIYVHKNEVVIIYSAWYHGTLLVQLKGPYVTFEVKLNCMKYFNGNGIIHI